MDELKISNQPQSIQSRKVKKGNVSIWVNRVVKGICVFVFVFIGFSFWVYHGMEKYAKAHPDVVAKIEVQSLLQQMAGKNHGAPVKMVAAFNQTPMIQAPNKTGIMPQASLNKTGTMTQASLKKSGMVSMPLHKTAFNTKASTHKMTKPMKSAKNQRKVASTSHARLKYASAKTQKSRAHKEE